MSQKTISVNPELFNLSGNSNTRKKKEKSPNEIKMKPRTVRKNDTLKKQSLLRMIRKHQQDKYRENVKESKDIPKDNYSFEQTKAFLSSLNNKNKTLKSETDIFARSQPSSTTSSSTTTTDILQQEVDEMNGGSNNLSVHMHVSAPNLNTQPKYGCLKNGKLPTYRMTMKNREMVQQPQHHVQTPSTHVATTSYPSFQTPSFQTPLEQSSIMSNSNNQTPRLVERQLMNIQSSNPNESNALNRFNEQYQARQRQKKIHRRTYNVGKSKTVPEVSVLVSNKKIRTNVTMKLQCIKQEPVEKIRKELIKRGLIRVGSLTPESLLRKMYETVEMICGDVKNHNPDNLLYNYFHVEE